METYYPELVGGIHSFEKVNTLPEFNAETDIGNVIYVRFENAFYFGTAVGWYGLGPHGSSGGTGVTGGSGGSGDIGNSGGTGGVGYTGATGGADVACCFDFAVTNIPTTNTEEDYYQLIDAWTITHNLQSNYYFINIFHTDGTEYILKDSQVLDKSTVSFNLQDIEGYFNKGHVIVTKALCGRDPAPYYKEQHDYFNTWLVNVDPRLLDIDGVEIYFYSIFGELLKPLSMVGINTTQIQVEFDQCYSGYSFVWADANPEYMSGGFVHLYHEFEAELIVDYPVNQWVLEHNFNVDDPEIELEYEVLDHEGNPCQQFSFDFEKYETQQDFYDAKGLRPDTSSSRQALALCLCLMPLQPLVYNNPERSDFTEVSLSNPIAPFNKDHEGYNDSDLPALKPPFNNYKNSTTPPYFEDKVGYVIYSNNATTIKLAWYKFKNESLPVPTIQSGKLTAKYIQDEIKPKAYNSYKKVNEHIHVQHLTSSIWVIQHNLNSKNLRVNLDLNDDAKYLICYLTPDKIKIYFYRYDHEFLAYEDVDNKSKDRMLPSNITLVKRHGHGFIFRSIPLVGYNVSDVPSMKTFPEDGRILMHTQYYPEIDEDEASHRLSLRHFPIRSLVAKEKELDRVLQCMTIRHNIGTKTNLEVEFHEILDIKNIVRVDPDFIVFESDDVLRLYFTVPAEKPIDDMGPVVERVVYKRGIVKVYQVAVNEILPLLKDDSNKPYYKNIVTETHQDLKNTYSYIQRKVDTIWSIKHDLLLSNLDLYSFYTSSCNNEPSCLIDLPHKINIIKSDLLDPTNQCININDHLLEIVYISNDEFELVFDIPILGTVVFSIDLPLESLIIPQSSGILSDPTPPDYMLYADLQPVHTHLQHLKSHVWYVTHNLSTMNPSVYAICNGIAESYSFNDLQSVNCRHPVATRIYPRLEVLNQNKVKLIFEQVLSYQGAAIITVKDETLYNTLKDLPWLIFGESTVEGSPSSQDFQSFSKQDFLDLRETYNSDPSLLPRRPSNLTFQALDNYGESLSPHENAVYLTENTVELDFKNLLYLQQRLLNGYCIIKSVDVQYDPTRIDSQQVQIYDQSREPEYLTISTPVTGKAYITDGNFQAMRAPRSVFSAGAIQVPPSKVWIIKHDYNTTSLSIRCYDPIGEPMYPDAIQFVSDNEIRIYHSVIRVLKDDGKSTEEWDDVPKRWEMDNYDVNSRLLLSVVSDEWPVRPESSYLYHHEVDTWKEHIKKTEGRNDYTRAQSSPWSDLYWKVRHNLNTKYPKLTFLNPDGSLMQFNGDFGINQPPFRIYYINEQYLEVCWLPSDPSVNTSMRTPGSVMCQRIVRAVDQLECHSALAGTGITGQTGGIGESGGTGGAITGGTGMTGESLLEAFHVPLPPEADYISVMDTTSLAEVLLDNKPLSGDCGCFQFVSPASPYEIITTQEELDAYKLSLVTESECAWANSGGVLDCININYWIPRVYWSHQNRDTLLFNERIVPGGQTDYWYWGYYYSASTYRTVYWRGDSTTAGDESKFDYLYYLLTTSDTTSEHWPYINEDPDNFDRAMHYDHRTLAGYGMPLGSTTGNGSILSILGYVNGHTLALVANIKAACTLTPDGETTNGCGLWYDYGLPGQSLLMDYPTGYADDRDGNGIRDTGLGWFSNNTTQHIRSVACIKSGLLQFHFSNWADRYNAMGNLRYFDLRSDPRTAVFESQCQIGMGAIGASRVYPTLQFTFHAGDVALPPFPVPRTKVWDKIDSLDNKYWSWSDMPDCEWTVEPANCIGITVPPVVWDEEAHEYYTWSGLPVCDWEATMGNYEQLECPAGVGGTGGSGGSGGTGRRNIVSFEAGACPFDFDGVDDMQSNFGTSVLRFVPDYPNNRARTIVFDKGFNSIPMLTELFKEDMEDDGTTPKDQELYPFIHPATDQQWKHARYIYTIDRGGTRIGVKLQEDPFVASGGECDPPNQINTVDMDECKFIRDSEEALDFESRPLYSLKRTSANLILDIFRIPRMWDSMFYLKGEKAITLEPPKVDYEDNKLSVAIPIPIEPITDPPPLSPRKLETKDVQYVFNYTLFKTSLIGKEFVALIKGSDNKGIVTKGIVEKNPDGSPIYVIPQSVFIVIAYKVIGDRTYTLSIIRRHTLRNRSQIRPSDATFYLVYNYGLEDEEFLYENFAIGTNLGVDRGASASLGWYVGMTDDEPPEPIRSGQQVRLSVSRSGNKIRFNSSLFDLGGTKFVSSQNGTTGMTSFPDPDVVVDLASHPLMYKFINDKHENGKTVAQFFGIGMASLPTINATLELYDIDTSNHDIPDVCDQGSGMLWKWDDYLWKWNQVAGGCCRKSDFRFIAAQSSLRYYDISWYSQWYLDNPNDIYDPLDLVGFTGHPGEFVAGEDQWTEESVHVLTDEYFAGLARISGSAGSWVWCSNYYDVDDEPIEVSYDVRTYWDNWIVASYSTYATLEVYDTRPPRYGSADGYYITDSGRQYGPYACRKKVYSEFTGKWSHTFCAAMTTKLLSDGIVATRGEVFNVLEISPSTNGFFVLDPVNAYWVPVNAKAIENAFNVPYETFMKDRPESDLTYWYCQGGSFVIWTYESMWVQILDKENHHDYWELRGGARHWVGFRKFLKDNFLANVGPNEAPGCKTEGYDHEVWWIWTGNTGSSPAHYEGPSYTKGSSPDKYTTALSVDTPYENSGGDGPGGAPHWAKDSQGRFIWVNRFASTKTTETSYPVNSPEVYVLTDWEYEYSEGITQQPDYELGDLSQYQYIFWPWASAPPSFVQRGTDTDDPNMITLGSDIISRPPGTHLQKEDVSSYMKYVFETIVPEIVGVDAVPAIRAEPAKEATLRVPAIPEVLPIPRVPATATTPEIPGIPGTPGVPEVPFQPATEAIEYVPAIRGIATIPEHIITTTRQWPLKVLYLVSEINDDNDHRLIVFDDQRSDRSFPPGMDYDLSGHGLVGIPQYDADGKFITHTWTDYGPVMTNKSGFVWDQWNKADHRNINVCQKLAINTYIENQGRDLYFEFSNGLTGDPVNIWWQVINQPEKLEIAVQYMYIHENRWLRYLQDPIHREIFPGARSVEESSDGTTPVMEEPSKVFAWNCDLDSAYIINDASEVMGLQLRAQAVECPVDNGFGDYELLYMPDEGIPYIIIDPSHDSLTGVQQDLTKYVFTCYPLSCRSRGYATCQDSNINELQPPAQTAKDVFDNWEFKSTIYDFRTLHPDLGDSVDLTPEQADIRFQRTDDTQDQAFIYDASKDMIKGIEGYINHKILEDVTMTYDADMSLPEISDFDVKYINYTRFNAINVQYMFLGPWVKNFKLSAVIGCNSRIRQERVATYEEYDTTHPDFIHTDRDHDVGVGFLYEFPLEGRNEVQDFRSFITRHPHSYTQGHVDDLIQTVQTVDGAHRDDNPADPLLEHPDLDDPFLRAETDALDEGLYYRVSMCFNDGVMTSGYSGYGRLGDALPIELDLTTTYNYRLNGWTPTRPLITISSNRANLITDICYEANIYHSPEQKYWGEHPDELIIPAIWNGSDTWYDFNKEYCRWDSHVGDPPPEPVPPPAFSLNPIILFDEAGEIDRAWYWNAIQCSYTECDGVIQPKGTEPIELVIVPAVWDWDCNLDYAIEIFDESEIIAYRAKALNVSTECEEKPPMTESGLDYIETMDPTSLKVSLVEDDCYCFPKCGCSDCAPELNELTPQEIFDNWTIQMSMNDGVPQSSTKDECWYLDDGIIRSKTSFNRDYFDSSIDQRNPLPPDQYDQVVVHLKSPPVGDFTISAVCNVNSRYIKMVDVDTNQLDDVHNYQPQTQLYGGVGFSLIADNGASETVFTHQTMWYDADGVMEVEGIGCYRFYLNLWNSFGDGSASGGGPGDYTNPVPDLNDPYWLGEDDVEDEGWYVRQYVCRQGDTITSMRSQFGRAGDPLPLDPSTKLVKTMGISFYDDFIGEYSIALSSVGRGAAAFREICFQTNFDNVVEPMAHDVIPRLLDINYNEWWWYDTSACEWFTYPGETIICPAPYDNNPLILFGSDGEPERVWKWDVCDYIECTNIIQDPSTIPQDPDEYPYIEPDPCVPPDPRVYYWDCDLDDPYFVDDASEVEAYSIAGEVSLRPPGSIEGFEVLNRPSDGMPYVTVAGSYAAYQTKAVLTEQVFTCYPKHCVDGEDCLQLLNETDTKDVFDNWDLICTFSEHDQIHPFNYVVPRDEYLSYDVAKDMIRVSADYIHPDIVADITIASSSLLGDPISDSLFTNADVYYMLVGPPVSEVKSFKFSCLIGCDSRLEAWLYDAAREWADANDPGGLYTDIAANAGIGYWSDKPDVWGDQTTKIYHTSTPYRYLHTDNQLYESSWRRTMNFGGASSGLPSTADFPFAARAHDPFMRLESEALGEGLFYRLSVCYDGTRITYGKSAYGRRTDPLPIIDTYNTSANVDGHARPFIHLGMRREHLILDVCYQPHLYTTEEDLYAAMNPDEVIVPAIWDGASTWYDFDKATCIWTTHPGTAPAVSDAEDPFDTKPILMFNDDGDLEKVWKWDVVNYEYVTCHQILQPAGSPPQVIPDDPDSLGTLGDDPEA